MRSLAHQSGLRLDARQGLLAMVFYDFLRWNLAWMATVALLWPLNMALAALAYKVRQGNPEIEMEPREFWFRCGLGTFLLALFTVALFGVDYWLGEAEFPAGMIHVVVFFAYVGGAWWLFFQFFDLDDPFEGLSLFVLYMYLPLAVLYPINKIVGLWNPYVEYVASWLKEP